MKKFLSILLCTVFVIALCVTPAFAATTSGKTTTYNLRKGDVNRDGKITFVDALLALRGANGYIALTADQTWCADLDGNGLTQADAEAIQKIAMGTILPGDVNGDGKVTKADVTLAQKATMGLVTLTSERYWAADLDKNGLTSVDVVALLRVVKKNIKKYDVNADGKVTSVDALYASCIMQGIGNYTNPGWYWSADVDNNGIMNRADVEAILRKAMGL